MAVLRLCVREGRFLGRRHARLLEAPWEGHRQLGAGAPVTWVLYPDTHQSQIHGFIIKTIGNCWAAESLLRYFIFEPSLFANPILASPSDATVS